MVNNQNHTSLDKLLIAIAILYNTAILLFSLCWLFSDAFLDIKITLKESNFMGLNEKVTYSLFLSGMLGATFYCLRGIYQRIGQAYTPINGVPEPLKNFNIKAWLFWYLFRPLQGGVLALILLALVNSRLLTAPDLNESTINSFHTQIAIGFLAGFGSHELIHKIEEIIKVLFAKSKISGSNSEEKVKENNN